ncbi:MAG: hypothetical protein ABIO70_03035 [Pseudomonadota bacterium]
MIAPVLLLAAALAQQPADAVSAATPAPDTMIAWRRRVYVGAQVDNLFPVGVAAQLGFGDDVRPTWDLDLLVEPSRTWQSVSLGAAWRPLRNAFAVGGRARWLQLHPPWSRAYHAAWDNALALGLELGGRWGLMDYDRLQLSAGLGAFVTPIGAADLPPMIEAHVGAAWRVRMR